MNIVTPILGIILYMIASILAMMRLFHYEKRRQKYYLCSSIIVIAFIAINIHAWVLVKDIITTDGFNLDFFQVFSLSSWIIAVVLVFSMLTKPIENLIIFLFPPITVAMAIAAFSDSSHFIQVSSGWSISFHVITSLIAWALFAIASVQAIILAIQDYYLHNRYPNSFFQVSPPLETMENLLFKLIITGFILLSLSLITGFLFLDNIWEQHLAHKTLLSISAWIVFFILLWGRYCYGWRSRRALCWILVGFIVLLLAYFGSKAVIELVLN